MRVFLVLTLAALTGCVRLAGIDSPLPKPTEVTPAAPVQVPALALPTAFAEPAVLANRSKSPGTVEVDLRAAAARLELLPGKPTDLLAYNGSVPGPTLDLHEGDHVVVHFKNNLPAPTNVHWHGLPIPPDQDGLPMDLIPAGGSRDYTFDVPRGTAGTYWYHPHPHGATVDQVMRGMAGAIRVRAAVDPLPAAFGDTLVVLWDNRFTADGAIAPLVNMDRMDGREGDVIFVNGKVAPKLVLQPGETRRFRFVNASASRFYAVGVPGRAMVQVGTDGGLFERPVETLALTLAPGERAEVLVRGEAAGKRFSVGSWPVDRGAMAKSIVVETGGHGHDNAAFPLFTLAYGEGEAEHGIAIPPLLRQVPAIDVAAAVPRSLAFTENMLRLDFKINDMAFDPQRIDIRAKAGATEVWTLDNRADMDHPFHLHGYRFQVLDRAGLAEPFAAWKDTVNVRKGERVRFAVKLEGAPGLRVYHCHILNHEDLGMMGTLLVE